MRRRRKTSAGALAALALGCRFGVAHVAPFNSDAPGDGKEFAVMIDAPLHRVANQIKDWPTNDLYATYSL